MKQIKTSDLTKGLLVMIVLLLVSLVFIIAVQHDKDDDQLSPNWYYRNNVSDDADVDYLIPGDIIQYGDRMQLEIVEFTEVDTVYTRKAYAKTQADKENLIEIPVDIIMDIEANMEKE